MTFTLENKPLGYLNLYRRKNGDIEAGSADLYDSKEQAKGFNAAEFDGVDGSKYLGVAAVILLTGADT